MRNRVLIAAILIMPSTLLAQPGRGTSPARARSTTHWSSSARRVRTSPQSLQAKFSRVVASANSNPLLSGSPASVSPAARASALRALTANAWASFFPATRSLSGNGSARGFGGGLSGQRALKGSTPTPPPPTPTPAPVYVPPYDYTPGALIRTAGLGYTATPANDAHYANNDTGYAIVQDPNQTVILDSYSQARVGAPDKLPPANPGLGGSASGRNAITPNAAPNGN